MGQNCTPALASAVNAASQLWPRTFLLEQPSWPSTVQWDDGTVSSDSPPPCEPPTTTQLIV